MHKTDLSRRKFIRNASAAVAMGAVQGTGLFRGVKERNRMILTFYLDDANPQIVPAEAYADFVDYCSKEGIRGEISLILGYSGKSLTRDPDENQKRYIGQVKKAYDRGIDSQMEIMTHQKLFDFKANHEIETAGHEGIWLHEPAVSVSEYQAYFSSIIDEAQKEGLKFTGLTWPGCGCEVCTKRYAELKKEGPLHISQNAFDALLDLASMGKFRSRVLPVFYESSETDYGIFRRAASGKYGVYDLMPNAKDQFGIWENSTEHVNPDYYITEDGKNGIIIRHLEDNVPYCMWYMHWQGVNPANGVGWQAFRTVTRRIKQHLGNKVIWMRPSDIVTAYHDAGSWDFTGNL